MLFYSMNLGEANIMTVYILGVLIAALKTSKRLYSVVLSVLNVLAFDFYLLNLDILLRHMTQYILLRSL